MENSKNPIAYWCWKYTYWVSFLFFLSYFSMKNLKLFSLLGIALFSCALVGCVSDNDTNDNDIIIEEITTNEGAIDYNDNLVDLTEDCFASEEDVWAAYDWGSAEELQAAIDNTVALCNVAFNNVQVVEPLEEDATLRDGVLQILEGEINYYAKMGDLVAYQSYTEEDFDNMSEEDAVAYEAIVQELDSIYALNEEANNALVTIQEEFAANHGYELEEE